MRMLFQIFRLAGLAIVAAAAAGFATAQAAPQVLALVATGDKVELTCHGDQCDAEFSAFCLQPDKFSPTRGTPYRLVSDDQVRLTGTTADGREVALETSRFLRFRSMRTHVAMRLSVARAEIDRLGLTRLSVEVGETATLLPVPEPGEAEDADATDIALLGGPLRNLGAGIVDHNQDRMGAARIANRIINLLPGDSRASVEPGGALWRRAVAGAGGERIGRRARDMARTAIQMCNYAVTATGFGSMRHCLQTKHDVFVDFLNSDYWKAVKTGS